MTSADKINIFCAICAFNFFLYRFFYWRGYHNGILEAKRILEEIRNNEER